MARIGFVGLGRMGAHMARNLVKAGHEVVAFDIVPEAVAVVVASGATAAFSSAAAARDADVVITMLPAGEQVRDAWLGQGGLMKAARADALLMDCSTIDVATARDVAAAAGRPFLDAPVSGGVMGAEAGTLTFMVGGSAEAVARARPVLEAMGRTIVHCGEAGAGQVAKLCNNMMLAATMAVTSEAFVMAEKLGLPAQALYDVCSKSTAMSWALNNYCPVPGPVPASPANRDFAPGFTAALMRKDLGLAQQAAKDAGVATPVGALALSLFDRLVEGGAADKDFSAIITLVREGAAS
ncbi:3-hydroxyisobutyrate dehydrogenase [Roseomonas fluvialis]|uniref:3-hydroxyisobutyrate dehydrogenase n=1 Tax=Roseomonas fluvialis TaxID=1750527 RepID=A0ABM7Y441_9PROT|nr:3-hydroxyisobutyrate dehydrogenase [Roseomonas fluvialis]BDG72658.1 3-hydroxyisobutyrate dehydrogenase [Roseomonas fluvialis]